MSTAGLRNPPGPAEGGYTGIVEVVVLVGLPAAGKSTFFRRHFAATHVHVSKDNFRSARRPAKTQARLIREALEAGQDVVVDNTNASAEEREAVSTIAREFGARTVAYVFPGTVADCRERNDLREGKEKVPLVGLYTVAKRLRYPTEEEGFEVRYRVELAEGDFVVRPWEDDESERA